MFSFKFKKPAAIILLSLVFLSSVSYAKRTVENILGVHFIPKVEENLCLKLEEKSDGGINKTLCLLKMKYVNELCKKMIETNFPETIPNEDAQTVESEFVLCRIFILSGEGYKFGIASEAQLILEQNNSKWPDSLK